jgi:hypothetical protein
MSKGGAISYESDQRETHCRRFFEVERWKKDTRILELRAKEVESRRSTSVKSIMNECRGSDQRSRVREMILNE